MTLCLRNVIRRETGVLDKKAWHLAHLKGIMYKYHYRPTPDVYGVCSVPVIIVTYRCFDSLATQQYFTHSTSTKSSSCNQSCSYNIGDLEMFALGPTHFVLLVAVGLGNICVDLF